MADPVSIATADDPRIADYIGLTDPDLRVRTERDGGFFIVEGMKAVERLLHSPGFRIRSLLLTPRAAERLGPDPAGPAVPVFVAEPTVLREAVGFAIHRGVVASAWRPTLPSVEEAVAGARSVLVLEGINDHENLGGLFRNAAAFGADAVVLDPTCADPFYRRSVRVSMGHVLGVTIARSTEWPATLHDLHDLGFTVVALTPAVGSHLIHEVRVEGPVALLVGAESPGLTAAAIAAADLAVRIPMAPGIDSLNVATASAVAMHRLAPHDLS